MSFHRTPRVLLQVSGRTTRSASLERYGLIRNFFLRQVTPAPPATTHTVTPPSFVRNFVTQQKAGSSYRHFHTTFRVQEEVKPREPNDTEKPSDASKNNGKDGPATDPRYLENYSKFFRQLAMSLPHLSRPTRDDFLNAATGFWSRMRVRFKWLTIRSFRRYNADDISAFVTWFVMSQTVWLLVGTYVLTLCSWSTFIHDSSSTTFFSVVFATINSLRLQGAQHIMRHEYTKLICIYA